MEEVSFFVVESLSLVEALFLAVVGHVVGSAVGSAVASFFVVVTSFLVVVGSDMESFLGVEGLFPAFASFVDSTLRTYFEDIPDYLEIVEAFDFALAISFYLHETVYNFYYFFLLFFP